MNQFDEKVGDFQATVSASVQQLTTNLGDYDHEMEQLGITIDKVENLLERKLDKNDVAKIWKHF